MSDEKIKWAKIGKIVKNEAKDKDKKVILDANGQKTYYMSFKLEPGVTIQIDGKEVDINQYGSGQLVTPQQEVEQLYKAGKIDEDKIEFRREKSAEAHSWLRYNIIIPPPRG